MEKYYAFSNNLEIKKDKGVGKACEKIYNFFKGSFPYPATEERNKVDWKYSEF